MHPLSAILNFWDKAANTFEAKKPQKIIASKTCLIFLNDWKTVLFLAWLMFLIFAYVFNP